MEEAADIKAQLWYAVGFPETLEYWNSDANSGLTTREAEDRLHQFGENLLSETRKPSPILAFLRHFTDFIVLVLFAAVAISILLGEWLDAIAILAIIFINAIIGFMQEYRSERASGTAQTLNTDSRSNT